MACNYNYLSFFSRNLIKTDKHLLVLWFWNTFNSFNKWILIHLIISWNQAVSKIIADMKLRLVPWKKSYDKLSVFKSRDITLPTKVHIVKAIFFSVFMYSVRVGPWRWLSTEELILLNCSARKDSWKSLERKEFKPVNP